MVLKLLVFMLAVAVLEGVAGLQEKQFANETQIKANHDRKKRNGRLDKLPCIIEGGTCQTMGEHCNGVVRQGAEWCLHHRHFECCYPYGCEMDRVVYPHGAITENNCIILICENGNWVNYGWNPDCRLCYTYNMTNIVPHVNKDYKFPGPEGVYHFSGGFGPSVLQFGIDISFIPKDLPGDYCIEYILYYERGVTIYIIPDMGALKIFVALGWDPSIELLPDENNDVQTINTGFATVSIYNDPKDNVYIIGSYGLTVGVSHGFPCLMNVIAIASPSLYGDLNGLCGQWVDGSTTTPYPLSYPVTESNGGTTYDIVNFIETWKVRNTKKRTRQRNNKDIKKLLKDHTLQVNDQTIIEKSMSDIVKSCEEINKGLCSVLSSEECEILQETCLSRMSNVVVPGQGGSSDSSE